jgi:transposase InsO family protein
MHTTDQGAQFTSCAFSDVFKDAGVAISMDGKGRWVDNVFVERLWGECEVRGDLSVRLRNRGRGVGRPGWVLSIL